MKTITDYEVVDLGVDYPDYFQGFGVSCTPYWDCVCGIGDTPREALDDCLEQIATSYEIDVDALERSILADYPEFASVDQPSATEDMTEDEIGECYELPYWHIGIRWSM